MRLLLRRRQRRGSQVVRQRFAKPSYVGSNPIRASETTFANPSRPDRFGPAGVHGGPARDRRPGQPSSPPRLGPGRRARGGGCRYGNAHRPVGSPAICREVVAIGPIRRPPGGPVDAPTPTRPKRRDRPSREPDALVAIAARRFSILEIAGLIPSLPRWPAAPRARDDDELPNRDETVGRDRSVARHAPIVRGQRIDRADENLRFPFSLT